MTTEAMIERNWSAPSVEHDRGDLFSTTPEKVDVDKNVLATFFITCDRTTMTQDDILNGRLVCEIGIAPVRPAEFVIFRIFQNTAEAQR